MTVEAQNLPPQEGNTPDGFLVGTDPREAPRTAAEWGQPESQVGLSQQPPVVIQASTTTTNGSSTFYTAEDLERVRKEEKDKLYGRLGGMEDELKTLRQEREARLQAEQAAKEAEEAARRQQEEEQMAVRDLLNKREQEWNEKFESLRSDYDKDRAIFEQEKRFLELQQYRQARVDQEAEYIVPELRDLVTGNSVEEIDQSIDEMKARSAAIIQNVTGAVQQQPQMMRGTSSTAPPVGPLEQAPSYENITEADIRNMSMDDYKRNRDRLMQAASRFPNRGF